jgi:UDP-glucuronate decarboxylase
MSMARPRNVLVAGGAGFLGSHLCEALLAAGARVWCLDNMLTGSRANLRAMERHPHFTFLQHDVIQPVPAGWLPPALDEIYNLACAASPVQYQVDPEHTMLTSVVGTSNLLRLAERLAARFLLTSTSEVYGDPEVHPQPESYRGNVNCTGPRACYDEGKRASESLAFDFQRTNRVEVRVARLFNTYGPRMRADDGRVVSNIIIQALEGADVTVYGNGSQTRSFCYADDTIDALLRLMAYDGPQPGPVNIGNPLEMTVSHLVRQVLAITGSPSRIVHMPLPEDDPRRRRPDISRAGELLGWAPHTPLEEGLRATVAWFARRDAAADNPPRLLAT